VRVVWTPRAAARLSLINDTIAEANPRAASRVTARIVDRVRDLAQIPFQGRPGKMAGTRELVIVRTPYIVVYRIGRQQVDVITIIHGAQQWPPPRYRNKGS
jgi:toxin ParE1/3/4